MKINKQIAFEIVIKPEKEVITNAVLSVAEEVIAHFLAEKETNKEIQDIKKGLIKWRKSKDEYFKIDPEKRNSKDRSNIYSPEEEMDSLRRILERNSDITWMKESFYDWFDPEDFIEIKQIK